MPWQKREASWVNAHEGAAIYSRTSWILPVVRAVSLLDLCFGRIDYGGRDTLAVSGPYRNATKENIVAVGLPPHRQHCGVATVVANALLNPCVTSITEFNAFAVEFANSSIPYLGDVPQTCR